ncbi:hypothetical protein [Weeksella sp. HMSC059D05]|uniref:hypothetical protein n=1 Tax=Weeksella sp. HMSC059D05 TaxID=1715139 RepID=UPI0008A544F6|nr:hypothetical protein [Weeksella sp. HMSC059D05]OFM84587.1 hypothetical protein HMPREF2660_08735 [Weeksella sp. HMSC059D05]
MKNSERFISKLLGIESVEVKDKQINLSEDQRAKVEERLGAEQTRKLFEKMNAEINEQIEQEEQSKAIETVLEELEIETNSEEEEIEPSVNKQTEKATAEIKRLKEENNIMAKESIGDVPESIYKYALNLVDYAERKLPAHTATHIFGSIHSYDAFENRPWNQRLRDGSAKATTFSASEIPTLEGDAEHFVRQNPTVIESLFRDYEGLPKEWGVQTGIVDMITDAGISVGEIVQARKDHWAPKNKFLISVEAGKVFPKQIDIEFTGAELQRMETTWVRTVQNMNGSHPWKMSFIGFLLAEFIKQQRLDDRRAQILGVYVPTPNGYAGKAVNSQDGLLYHYWKARHVDFKYRPFNIGLPTPENAYDYIHQMIDLLPEDVRSSSGLEIQLSPTVLKWYNAIAALRYNHMYSTDEGKFNYSKSHPIDYPNIIFQPLKDMSNSLFVAITYSLNTEVLEYDPSEKGKFTVGHDKRDTYLFADYRLGIRLVRVGLKLAENHPDKYYAQMVWSNDAPIFDPNYKVPVYDNKSGVLSLRFNNVQIEDNFTNNITKIEGAIPGQVVKITGNKDLASDNVVLKKNDDLILESDFKLKTEGTITLFVQADGKLKELSRTDAAPVLENKEVNFASKSIDANEGNIFRFVGEEETTLSDILNGVDEKEIQIFGGNAKLTIGNNGSIHADENISLDSDANFVKLVKVADKWYVTQKG